jgi:hypothetical protein
MFTVQEEGTRVVVALFFSAVTPDRIVWSFGVDSSDIEISQQRCIMGYVLDSSITTGTIHGITQTVHDVMEGPFGWN